MEEGFPWWSRRLGAGAGHCSASLFSFVSCSPPCCRQGRLHFLDNGRAVQLLGRVVSAVWSQSSHVGCRYRIHTWGLLAQLAPQVACSWDRDELPPGAWGRGMSWWGGGGGGGQFVSSALLRGAPLRWAPSSCTDCRAQGAMGVLQPGSSLLRKKEHVAALESVSGSAWALATLDASPCALLHLFLPPFSTGEGRADVL